MVREISLLVTALWLLGATGCVNVPGMCCETDVMGCMDDIDDIEVIPIVIPDAARPAGGDVLLG